MGGTGQIIDVHQHPLPRWYLRRLADAGLAKLGGRSPDEPSLQWSPESALGQMDELGIAAALLSFSDPGASIGDPGFRRELARECNEYLADIAGQSHGRFGALAVLPLPDVEDALAELNHAADRLHLSGVVLLSNYGGTYLGDAQFDPLFAELSRRRLPVFLHPAMPAYDAPLAYFPWILEFVFNTTRAAMHLVYSGTLDRYPNIPIILAHGGGTLPFLSFRLDMGQRIPGLELAHPVRHYLSRFYYDTAFATAPEALSALLSLVEPSQLLFGSDLPFGTVPAAALSISQLAQSPRLDDRIREAIEHGSASRLFPGLAQARSSRGHALSTAK